MMMTLVRTTKRPIYLSCIKWAQIILLPFDITKPVRSFLVACSYCSEFLRKEISRTFPARVELAYLAHDSGFEFSHVQICDPSPSIYNRNVCKYYAVSDRMHSDGNFLGFSIPNPTTSGTGNRQPEPLASRFDKNK